MKISELSNQTEVLTPVLFVITRTYYSLSDFDIDVINKHRRDHNLPGFAIQLCILRHPGCTLNNMLEIPENLISYVAKQITHIIKED